MYNFNSDKLSGSYEHVDCVDIASGSVLPAAQFLHTASLIGRGKFQAAHRQEGSAVSVGL